MSDCRGFNRSTWVSRPSWEWYAETELAYLVGVRDHEISLPKAYDFFRYLQKLLPYGFDWLTHCEYGIDVDSGAPGELKVIFNFPGVDEHVLIKTRTTSYLPSIDFIVRDKFSKILETLPTYENQTNAFVNSCFQFIYKEYQNAQRTNS